MKQEEIEQLGIVSHDLKGVCQKYILKHLSKDFLAACEEMGIDLEEDSDYPNFIVAMDGFIFSGETASGTPVLDEILKREKLSKEKRDVLAEWRENAFESAFEISEFVDGGFRALDVVAEVRYDIYGNDREMFEKVKKTVEKGCFLATRIAPVHGVWFLSGAQFPISPSEEEFIFKNFILKSSPEAQLRNNPEKRRKVLEMQKEQHDHFVDIFGTDEPIVAGKDVVGKEREFYASWNRKLGKSERESAQNAESIIPDDLYEDLDECEEVGIVMDAEDGMYVVPRYREFQMLFLNPALDKRYRKENILEILKEDDLPAICLRRMRDRHPEEFREGVRLALPSFCRAADPVKYFKILMDKYRPGWNVFTPSVSLLNERFKKWYYTGRAGRNDPCPCGAKNKDGKPVKYKKCHGR